MTTKSADYESIKDDSEKKGAAVTSQPSSTEAIIIAEAPQPWKSGICNCCFNIPICLCSALCTNCYAAGLSCRLNENCLVPFCPGGLATMRTKLRLENKIEGNLLEDSVYSCVISPCVLCQMGNEMSAEQYPKVFCGLC